MTPSTTRRRRRPIYVESRIHAPIDALWHATQLPDSHQRWDVRFGSINYLPRVDGEAQRCTYATTVAPGVAIAGTGESLGERDRPDGSRWSGLKFWAADRRSIIEAGAGYWRYVPADDGVRFLTRYDYRPRWGRLGELVDRVLFRPAFGWATAWSFDRLRLWLEEGTPPERSRDQAIAHAAAVAGLVGVFAYQGLVPKVWKVDDGEVAIWRGLGLPQPTARRVVRAVGAVEAGFAVATVAAADKRWPSSSRSLPCPRWPWGLPSPTDRSSPRRSTPDPLASRSSRSRGWRWRLGRVARADDARCARRLTPNRPWRSFRDLDLPQGAR